MMANFDIQFNEDLDAPESKLLFDKLFEFNQSRVGPSDKKGVLLFSKNNAGDLIGGLRGFTFKNWLFVSELWVSESSRSTGLGSKLLRKAEQIAIERGCAGSYLDTFSFQALDFYLNLGYEVFGEVEDHPIGHKRIYLKKRFNA